MKSAKQNKWMMIIYAVILITLGVLTIVFTFANMELITEALGIAFAIGLFVIGLTHVITSLVAHTDSMFSASLVLGSVAIGIGVVFCIVPSIVPMFLVYFVGAFGCALGAVALIKAIVLAKFKQKGSWVFAYIMMALVSIAIGVLVFCFTRSTTVIIYVLIGAALLLGGVSELVLGLKALSAKKEEK